LGKKFGGGSDFVMKLSRKQRVMNMVSVLGRKGYGPMAPRIPLDALFAGLSENMNKTMGPFASISCESASNKRMK